MHVLITGGAGFLGDRLAQALLASYGLSLAGAPRQPIDRLTLVDRVPPRAERLADRRVAFVEGDLNAVLARRALALDGVDLIYHLAAAVSAECEADFDLGMRSNGAATLELLQACRAAGTAPVFVFSSSVAVFGDTAEQPLPPVVLDDTLPTPQNSYGIQKFIGEQWVADFTRKGFVRGRSVRLMTVSVRPGRPNGAASGFLSGMLREPLAGLRAVCPVTPDTAVALASPSNTVGGLLRAATASADDWGARSAVNLPAITTTAGEIAAALARIAGRAAADRIDWTFDPAVARIIASWPSRFDAARARRLGLQPDANIDALIHEYLRDHPEATAAGRSRPTA